MDLCDIVEKNNYIAELEGKIQFLVDAWPMKLEDNGITFPDGDYWPQSNSPEYKTMYGYNPEE